MSTKGKKLSAATREKMRLAKLGKKLSSEHVKRLRESHLGVLHTPESKAKISSTLKGRVITDEWRSKISHTLKSNGSSYYKHRVRVHGRTLVHDKLYQELKPHGFVAEKLFFKERPATWTTPRYRADLFHPGKLLVVEIDHPEAHRNKEYDKDRDEWFTSQGYSVLRFTDNDILTNISGVISQCLL